MNERSRTGHARMHVNNEATMGSEWQRQRQGERGREEGREGGRWNVYCNFYFHHLMHSLWQAALSLWLTWQHVANYEWMSAKRACTGGGGKGSMAACLMPHVPLTPPPLLMGPIGSLRNWHLRLPCRLSSAALLWPQCDKCTSSAHQYAQQLRPQTPRSALLIIFCGDSELHWEWHYISVKKAAG